MSNTKRQHLPVVNPLESDSYKTCASSLVKPVEKKSEETEQASSDDNLFLIHQRERGVSLPVLMTINCDDIALRLSTSSPIDTHSHPIGQLQSASSTHSEPPITLRPTLDNPASSFSVSSHESEQIPHPSWLSTINTVTTTTGETAGRMFQQKSSFVDSAILSF